MTSRSRRGRKTYSRTYVFDQMFNRGKIKIKPNNSSTNTIIRSSMHHQLLPVTAPPASRHVTTASPASRHVTTSPGARASQQCPSSASSRRRGTSGRRENWVVAGQIPVKAGTGQPPEQAALTPQPRSTQLTGVRAPRRRAAPGRAEGGRRRWQRKSVSAGRENTGAGTGGGRTGSGGAARPIVLAQAPSRGAGRRTESRSRPNQPVSRETP